MPSTLEKSILAFKHVLVTPCVHAAVHITCLSCARSAVRLPIGVFLAAVHTGKVFSGAAELALQPAHGRIAACIVTLIQILQAPFGVALAARGTSAKVADVLFDPGGRGR